MTVYAFTLIVEGPDLQEEAHLGALFESGFDDATIGRVGTIQFLEFDREAESFAEAVLSATETLESVIPGVRVEHLEPDDLLTMSEIAERVGRTGESVRLLISGERGPAGFPAPATHFRSRQRMWRWQEVAIWFAEELGEAQFVGVVKESHFITAFNSGLKWRKVDEDLQRQIKRRVG